MTNRAAIALLLTGFLLSPVLARAQCDPTSHGQAIRADGGTFPSGWNLDTYRITAGGADWAWSGKFPPGDLQTGGPAGPGTRVAYLAYAWGWNGFSTQAPFYCDNPNGGCLSCTDFGLVVFPPAPGLDYPNWQCDNGDDDDEEDGGSCSASGGSSGPMCVGRPVNVVSGNVYLHQTDVSIPGVNRDGLRFVRSYDSLGRDYAGALGPGWIHNYEQRVGVVDEHVLVLRKLRGGNYYADPDGDSRYDASYPESKASWIIKSGTGYVRYHRRGGSETYNTAGKLTSIVDPVGNVTTLHYDPLGRLVRVADPSGRELWFEYRGNTNEMTALLGPDGVIATYRVISGRLEGVTYAEGTGYTFAYLQNTALLNTVRDLTGRVLEHHEYDPLTKKGVTSELADGREKYTITYQDPEPSEELPLPRTIVTDARGDTTTYEWVSTKRGRRVTKVTGPCASCQGGDDVQEWTYYGDVNLTVSPPVFDHAVGRPKTYKDALDHLTTYTYDPVTGNLEDTQATLDRTTHRTYDSQGRLETVTGPGDASTSYTWSAAGPLTVTQAVTDTTSRTTTYTYLQGKVHTITDPRQKVTTLVHDPVTGDLLTITDPLQHVTTFGYDAMGRRTTVKDAADKTTTTEYDAGGRVTRIIYPDTKTTEFTYDKGGRRETVKDPLGRITRYAYDKYGRLSSVLDPMEGETKYEYDLMGSLVALTDAKNQTTSFEYEKGRVKKVTYPGGAYEEFTYYPTGQLYTRTDRKGVGTTYDYDDAGRLTDKTYSDGTPAVHYTYYPTDRLWTAANGTDTLTWTYYRSGEVKTEASQLNTSEVAYAYDPAGNRASVTLNGQLFLSYPEYDDASRLKKITRSGQDFTFDYDNLNRRTPMTYPNNVATSYGYDDLSRLTHLGATHTPTVVTSFDYGLDAAGDRVSKTSTGTPAFVETYGYDDLSRLTSAVRTGTDPVIKRWLYDPVGNRTSDQTDNAVTQSTYNEKNQLSEVAGGGKLRFRGGLDELGAVTVRGKPARMLAGNPPYPSIFEVEVDVHEGQNTITVEAKDLVGNVRTQSFTVNVPEASLTQTFDANGNLATKTDSSGTWRYAWNAENQLLRVCLNTDPCTPEATTVARFRYDPIGRRVEKVAGTVTTAFTYDGEDILRRTAGGTTTFFIHGPGIDEPLASEQGGVLTYLHADGLGSIVATSNQAGARTSTIDYDPWGNILSGTPDGYAFTGREWDPEIQLYYYRARYYDPKIGRFISADPIGFFGGNNFYVYVEGDPVNSTDPTGLFRVCCRPVASTLFIKCHCWIILTNGQTLGAYRFGYLLQRIRNHSDDKPPKGGSPWGTSCTTLPMPTCKEREAEEEYNRQPESSHYGPHNTSNTPVSRALKVLPWRLPDCAMGGH